MDEIKYDQLNFDNVNLDRKLTKLHKTILFVLVVIFVFTPLYEISPETFHTNEIFQIFYSCFGVYYDFN